MRSLCSFITLFLFFHTTTLGQISATVTSERISLYTITPKHHSTPFLYEQTIESTGQETITDLILNYRVVKNGTVFLNQSDTLNLDSGQTLYDTLSFIGPEAGNYIVSVRASQAELGDNFFLKVYTSEVSNNELARDDGTMESALGFGFGDPGWYGYYGSEMFLPQMDTLIGISLFKTPGEQGTINLIVNTFDETGEFPVVERYHSGEIPISSGNAWIYHELEEPLPLFPGRYVFAAGQDTIQGVIGFGFDMDNLTEDGFWIVSPIAGGGYPWAQIFDRETLMIRPHFQTQDVPTAIKEVPQIQFEVKINPNPFKEQFYIESKMDKALDLKIFDSSGKLHHQFELAPFEHRIEVLPGIPSGLYFLVLSDGSNYTVQKIVKQ